VAWPRPLRALFIGEQQRPAAAEDIEPLRLHLRGVARHRRQPRRMRQRLER
jgi:hypothetical protein